MRILVIEDNPKLAASLERGLSEHGYSTDVCHTGFEGEEMAAAEPYDVIVLDLMLPDRDGLDVCRNLRRRDISTPILILSALSGTSQKVSGLDAGADDYITKPFKFEEFFARIRALLRRLEATEARELRHGDLILDLIQRVAHRADKKIDVSAKEFALLEFLMRNPGKVLTRTTIIEKVWDMNFEPASNVVDVYISNLRRKIDKEFDRPLIHTVIGSGYRFGLDKEQADAAR